MGFLAGFLAGLMNIPFDVAKSCIQASHGHSDKYLRTLSTLRTLQREEGCFAEALATRFTVIAVDTPISSVLPSTMSRQNGEKMISCCPALMVTRNNYVLAILDGVSSSQVFGSHKRFSSKATAFRTRYNTAPLLAHYYMQTFHSVGGAIMLVVYEQVLHYLEQRCYLV